MRWTRARISSARFALISSTCAPYQYEWNDWGGRTYLLVVGDFLTFLLRLTLDDLPSELSFESSRCRSVRSVDYDIGHEGKDEDSDSLEGIRQLDGMRGREGDERRDGLRSLLGRYWCRRYCQ